MTAPVYIHSGISSLRAGEPLVLGGAEGRHAATVRRTRVGELIDVVDGCGYRAMCEVTHTAKDAVTLRVFALLKEPEPRVRMTLVQALAKGGRDEQAVETATEYGAMRFIPWQAERCIANWKGKADKGRTRWEATARAAAKQARRAFVPVVDDVLTTRRLIEAAKEEGATLLVCHEESRLRLAAAVANNPELGEARNLWIVVGPEGGISAEEHEALLGAGAISVLLAPHVLRSASAGPYAIASLSGAYGMRWLESQ